jgi:hypothetical protein
MEAPSDSLAARTIFRMFSSMGCNLRTITSIVRFWGIITGKVGPILLRCKWFGLFGLAVVLELGA